MAKSFNLIEFYIKDVHFPNKKPDNAHKYDFGILFVYGGERLWWCCNYYVYKQH